MLIVWDYFGVIAQDAFWYTAERLAAGQGMSDAMHVAQAEADLGRITWDQYTEKVAEDIGVPIEQVRARYEDHEIKQQNILTIQHLPEHRHVLLSNASAGYLLPIMERLGLKNMFHEIYVSSQIGFAKPDQRAFEYVLRQNKTEPNMAVMIDDSLRNIDAAKNIGMNGIHFRPGVDVEKLLHTMLVE